MEIQHICASLPLELPNISSEYIDIALDLSNLTVLLGPNASGKTLCLETLGYIVAAHTSFDNKPLAYVLVDSLRPGRVAVQATTKFHSRPALMGFASSKYVHSMVTLQVPIEGPDERTRVTYTEILNLVRKFRENNISTNLIEKEFEKDMTILNELLTLLSIRKSLVDLHELYKLSEKLLDEIFGAKEIHISWLRSTELGYRPISKSSILRVDLLHMLRQMRFGLLKSRVTVVYSVYRELLSKDLLIETRYGLLLLSSRELSTSNLISVLAFTPSLTYFPELFETLYTAYVKRRRSKESEALEILKRYIEWCEGLDIIDNTLYLRHRGYRVPIYMLSNGQRVVTLLCLLYAMTVGPTLLLIDTPEAFVHPDGLPIVADVLARLVERGNQVIIATQSMEFLTELIKKCKEHRIVDKLELKRIFISNTGRIHVKGSWKGPVGADIILELQADLRR